jgi:hypothetical protein
MSWAVPGPAALVWIVSPDRSVREPIFYYDPERRRPISPGQFEQRVRDICAANNLVFREP